MPAQRTELAQGRVRPNSFPTRHTATSSRGTGRPVIPQLPLQLATQPRLASAPPMTRVVRTGENTGSTIMYPRQPPPFQQQYQQQQQPPYPHCYPVKALMPIQRMPQVPSGAMQQLPIAGQWSVQMNRQQPQAVGSFPVTWVQVPGPTGMVPMAVIQPHPAGFSQPAAVLSPTAYLNIPPSVRVPQLGRAPQPPSHRRIEPDPQRTAVPLSYELSTKDRVYFTQSNKPGLLVSAFQDDPHCLDSAEQEVGCLARHQEVRWIFSVSSLCLLTEIVLTHETAISGQGMKTNRRSLGYQGVLFLKTWP